MTKTYVDADIQIPDDDPEQKPTRQVGNGLVEQVILPRGAAVLLNAENIPLMPLEMSEESRYEKPFVSTVNWKVLLSHSKPKGFQHNNLALRQ